MQAVRLVERDKKDQWHDSSFHNMWYVQIPASHCRQSWSVNQRPCKHHQSSLPFIDDSSPLLPDFSVNPITCSNCTNPAPELVVSTHSVFKKLSTLNSSKVQGPDGIPAWLLKENADLFAEPVRDILNYSYREGHLPQSWKEADIIPVPKQKPIKVTVQFERCFQLMEHISVISCRNPIILYITEKLIKFSKSLFYFYLVISNK